MPSHVPDQETETRPPVPLNLKPPIPRRHPAGLILSLAFHGILLALLVAHGERLWSHTPAPGPLGLSGKASGGGGGGPRVSYITLPSIPEERPVPRKPAPAPQPTPRPVVDRAIPEPKPAESPVPEPLDTVTPNPAVAARDTAGGASPGTGGGINAGGKGPGQGPGAGPGAGLGTGGGGEGGKARPPEPRDMAFPFDNPPKELRGLSLNVTFWVRTDGRVERYLVEPEIKDRDYAKKFDEVMRAFRFTPARAPDGSSIPGTTRISFTLPGKSSS